jgi:flagellar hook-associated protein 3 FlgL
VRITSASYYNNIYGENNKLNRQLFDVNKQIASGLKIQYSHDDPTIFIDTLRLDNEITTLSQVKNSAQSAYKFSTQTDMTIGEIVKTIESMKVKLVNAANDSHSDSSLQAIAKELRGLQSHLMTLANTSIGGQYLFSGTATSVKPIGSDGTYQGNDQTLQAFLGSGVKQTYNITGSQLFLGSESTTYRKISTNVPQMSLTDLYPDIISNSTLSRADSKVSYISGNSTIRDLMGDTDTDTTNDAGRTSYFYLQGTKHDGESFKSTISLNMDDTVDDLLTAIKNEYGTTQVDVSINAHGQIEIIDKMAGSSKLDFHLVGAVDFDNANAGDAADISDPALYGATLGEIDNLQSGSTNFETAAITTQGLYIKEFTKSGFSTPSGTPNGIEGVNYDRTNFQKEGSKLLSNVSQVLKSDNSPATASTKLIDVSGNTTLVGTVLKLQGKNIDGHDYDIQIDLAASPSVSGTVNAVAITSFDIYNADPLRTVAGADELTYKQLMDVVNMTISGSLPLGNSAAQYDAAISSANALSSTTLDQSGKLVFQDKGSPITQASVSLYDATSTNYAITSGAALTFNANSSITLRDPQTDFFTRIEEIIRSVEQGKKRSDGSIGIDPRNLGVHNGIQMLDDLSDHVSKLQTQSGSYSQVLQASSDRSQLLIVNTKTLQSDIVDTDMAEATLKMQQLSLNYQALLSNISKVSKLSLVNYL